MKKRLPITVMHLLLLSTLLFLSCGNGDEIVIQQKLRVSGEHISLIEGYGPLHTFEIKEPAVYRFEVYNDLPSLITITPPFGRGYIWDGDRFGHFVYESFFPHPGLAAIRLKVDAAKAKDDLHTSIEIKRLNIERLEMGQMGKLNFRYAGDDSGTTEPNGVYSKFCWYLVEIKDPGSYTLKLEADGVVMVSLHGTDSIVSWRTSDGRVRNGVGEISRPGLYAIGAVLELSEQIKGEVGLFKE